MTVYNICRVNVFHRRNVIKKLEHCYFQTKRFLVEKIALINWYIFGIKLDKSLYFKNLAVKDSKITLRMLILSSLKMYRLINLVQIGLHILCKNITYIHIRHSIF